MNFLAFPSFCNVDTLYYQLNEERPAFGGSLDYKFNINVSWLSA